MSAPHASFTDRLAATQRGTRRAPQPVPRQTSVWFDHTAETAAPEPAAADTPFRDEFLTVKEVASILRFTARWVRTLIDDGVIEAHHFGKAVRISRVDLQRYIDRCHDSRQRLS